MSQQASTTESTNGSQPESTASGSGLRAGSLPDPFDLIVPQVKQLADRAIADGAEGLALTSDRSDDGPVLLGGTGAGPEHRVELATAGVAATVLVYGDDSIDLDRIGFEWDMASKLALKEAELRGITSGLIEANDQMLALYELAKVSATSISPEQLGRFLVDEAQRITRCEACVLIDDAGRHYFSGDEQYRHHVIDCLHRAENTSTLFRAGSHGLLTDVVVTFFEPDKPAALAITSPTSKRLTTPIRKLIDAVASYVGGMVTLATLHESEMASALIQRDVETAAALADQVMPKWTPSEPGIELSARSDSARLASGDFYTYVATDYGLMVAVGDVAGKGLPAALVMTMVSAATSAAAHRQPIPDPMAVLSAVNDDVYDYLSEAGVFVTMAVATWDRDEGLLSVANAGHSPVLYVAADGVSPIDPGDPPLGVLNSLSGVPVAIDMSTDDFLMLGSDGLAEQENADGVQLGYDGVERALMTNRSQAAVDVVAEMFDMVETHGQGVAQDDDRTALVLRRTPA